MAAKTGRVRRPNPPTFQPDVPPAAVGPATGGESFMSKKVAGVPMPIVLIVGVVVVYLVYRHYQANSVGSTSGSTSSSTAPDPNAIDPNTGLTYGAEEQAATNSMANSGVGGATGSGSTGASQEIGDLEGLLQALGAVGYNVGGGGSGPAPTPTNDQPGNGGGSIAPQFTFAPTVSYAAPAAAPAPGSSGDGGGGGAAPISAAGPSAAQVAASINEEVGAPVIAAIPNTNQSIDLADIPPQLANLPIVNLPPATVTGKDNGTGSVATTPKATTEKNAYNNPSTSTHIH